MAGGRHTPPISDPEKMQILNLVRDGASFTAIVDAFHGTRDRKTVMRWAWGFQWAARSPRQGLPTNLRYGLTPSALKSMADFVQDHPAQDASEAGRSAGMSRKEAGRAVHVGQLLATAQQMANALDMKAWGDAPIKAFLPQSLAELTEHELRMWDLRQERGEAAVAWTCRHDPTVGWRLLVGDETELRAHTPTHAVWATIPEWRAAREEFADAFIPWLSHLVAEAEETVELTIYCYHGPAITRGQRVPPPRACLLVGFWTVLADGITRPHLRRAGATDLPVGGLRTGRRPDGWVMAGLPAVLRPGVGGSPAAMLYPTKDDVVGYCAPGPDQERIVNGLQQLITANATRPAARSVVDLWLRQQVLRDAVVGGLRGLTSADLQPDVRCPACTG